MPEKLTPSDTLSELRFEHNKITQEQLAQETGIPQGTLSNYERNTYYPSAANLMILADYFDTSIDFIMGRTDCKMSISAFQDVICEDGKEAITIADLCNRVKRLDKDGAKKLVDYLRLLEKDK